MGSDPMIVTGLLNRCRELYALSRVMYMNWLIEFLLWKNSASYVIGGLDMGD